MKKLTTCVKKHWYIPDLIPYKYLSPVTNHAYTKSNSNLHLSS